MVCTKYGKQMQGESPFCAECGQAAEDAGSQSPRSTELVAGGSSPTRAPRPLDLDEETGPLLPAEYFGSNQPCSMVASNAWLVLGILLYVIMYGGVLVIGSLLGAMFGGSPELRTALTRRTPWIWRGCGMRSVCSEVHLQIKALAQAEGS
jgi:hypothetical protein